MINFKLLFSQSGSLQASERGVTLVEVLVGLGLFSVAAAGIMLSLTTSLRVAKITEMHHNASTIASSKLEEFASSNDNLEEIFENREQIEIARFYERLPKPTLIAIHEYLSDQLDLVENQEEN